MSPTPSLRPRGRLGPRPGARLRGFPPFRGGPLNYARTRGPENVVSTLRALAQKFGDRFTPDAGWETFK